MTVTLEPLTAPVTADEIRRRIAKVPRVPLALTPTPLQEAPRLAAELGIGRLLIKRDDLTGLAFGGNKTRNLEFRMAEAVELGAPDDRRRQHPRDADHPGTADRPRLGLAGQPADRPHPRRRCPLAGDR